MADTKDKIKDKIDDAADKAKEATDLGKQSGYPLFFTTEPEE